MKKFISMLIALMLLATFACAEDLQVQIIGEATGDGSVAAEEVISIDHICDVKLFGAVAGTYAMSMPAYARPEDELFLTPEVPTVNAFSDFYGGCERYKYESNADGNVVYCGYVEVYVDIGAAVQASSDDYQLLDVRMSILNRMLSPMEVTEKIQVKLTYDDYYVFETPAIWMETADTLGNPNEWLTAATPIPMLVERTTHFIFEVPKIVTTSTEPLVATITINGEDYTYTIR